MNKNLTNGKEILIYNLILMLSDERDECIDNQDFIDYVCEESGMDENVYKMIMEVK